MRTRQTLDRPFGHRKLFLILYYWQQDCFLLSEHWSSMCINIEAHWFYFSINVVKAEGIVPLLHFVQHTNHSNPARKIPASVSHARACQRRPTHTVNIQNITRFLFPTTLNIALQRTFILGRKQAGGGKQSVPHSPADNLWGFLVFVLFALFLPAECLAEKFFHGFGISVQNFFKSSFRRTTSLVFVLFCFVMKEHL